MHDEAEARLLAVFRALSESDRQALQDYAGLLAVRVSAPGAAAGIAPTGFQQEPRPDSESVVMAIRRLTRSYPLLDRRKLIGRTSQLMAEHALHGRAATEVIDELEVVFEHHYRELTQCQDQ